MNKGRVILDIQYTADGDIVRKVYGTVSAQMADSKTMELETMSASASEFRIEERCGSHVYYNKKLERAYNDYGYWAGGKYYYNICDYLGNVRTVVDSDGALYERNDYYPYGMLHDPAGDNPDIQPHKYGSKELDRKYGLDLYDSQARWYDPTLGRSTTMDPLAEKTPDISPYVWCGANPVRNIDPDGCDTLSLNNQGYINLKTKTYDDFDVILAENGSTMNVSKSFMKDRFSGRIHGTDGNDYDCDYYEVDGSEELKSIFEFLVTNTDVEWSRLIYSDDKGMVGNSHHRERDGSADKFWQTNPSRQNSLQYFDHSHPFASHPSKGDIKIYNDFRKKAPQVKARVYNRNDINNPIYYDRDYDMSQPVKLPHFEVKFSR